MTERADSPESGIELSVIVPCFNEELNVPELTRRVLAAFDHGKLRGELVLVDDGSRDGTRRVIEEQMQLSPGRVVGQFHRKNAGMAAWRTGVNAARGTNVATIDADLQYQPEDLLRLYHTLIESSVDIVQGYRSSVGRLRDGRFVLSRGLNIILNGSFGMNLRDNKSGFVCCAKEVMQDLLRYKGRYAYWQSFIMAAAHAKGYSYREIETLFEDRKQGQSFLDGQAYRAAARNFVDVGRALWEYRLNAEPRDPSLRILEPSAGTVAQGHAAFGGRMYFRARSLPLHAAPRTVQRSFETLDATQWLSASKLSELQTEKLRRLIRHAYRVVPYYRARMQELGLHPVDIRSLDDLPRLPLLNRDDVRQNLYFDMVQDGVSPADLVHVRSSGKPCEPLVGYVGKSDQAFRLAAALRANEWTGCRFSESSLRIGYDADPSNPSDSIRETLASIGAGRATIAIDRLDAGKLSELASRISRHKPALIEADAEILTALADHASSSRAAFAQPRAVLSTGQRLSPEHRAHIEGAFGCKVYDLYSSGEFGGIACETGTPDEHMVFAESCIVELLVEGRAARPGEIGEVVVTDLNNQVMPLIRYRIGDLAEAVDNTRASPCGRGLPRIGRILGRGHGFVRGRDDSFVPSGFFDHLFKDYFFAVRKFRVTQDVPGAIRLEIVKASRYSDETLERIEALIRAALGPDFGIDVVFSDGEDIPRSSATASRHPLEAQRSSTRSVQHRHGN